MWVVVVAVICAAATSLLAWRRGLHAAVIVLLLCGLLQAPLVSLFRSQAFTVGDDAAAIVILVLGAWTMIRRRSNTDLIVGGVAILWAALCLIAVVRSPTLGVGVQEARQAVFPVGLALTGFSLRREICWSKVMNACVVMACVAALYALIEWGIHRPLIDPSYITSGGQPVDPGTRREGLPFAYVSDTPAGTIIRAGGPFLNPPSTGFFLAAGVIASLLAGLLLPVALYAAGLAVAYARAGMVMAGLSSIAAVCWHYLGRLISVILVGAAAFALGAVFIEQGNTASHVQGLVRGTVYAISHPAGQGFGRAGYQAALASSGPVDGVGNESLLGLYFAWFGLPALLFVGASLVWLVVILLRSKVSTGQAWAALAVMVGAAVSETASSLAAAALLWLVLGATMGLQDLRSPRDGSPRWADLAALRKFFAPKGSDGAHPGRTPSPFGRARIRLDGAGATADPGDRDVTSD